jgi:hypothetical protein
MIAPDTASVHDLSLAVWDVPSPAVSGRRTTLKIGISCPSGCSLSGTTIDIRNAEGAAIASGRVGSELWPDTLALYWVELDVAAPETEGTHALSIHAASQDSVHPPLESIVRIVASRPPEHRARFEVIEKGNGLPLSGVELRVGPFRAVTDDGGIACVDVPGGIYEVCAWKIGHDLFTTTTHVAADMSIQLEIAVTLLPDQPYWM